MRNLTLAALGASTLVLSGCSLFDGMNGNNNSYGHTMNAPYQNGTYNTGTAGCAPQKQRCVGGPALSTWNLEGAIGPAFLVGGEAFTGDKINAANPNTLRNIDMNDAYDTGWRAELGGSYALNPNRKITLNAFTQQHESDGAQNIGIVNGQAATGSFSDYEAYGIEAGLRQYFQPRVIGNDFGLRPYVEGKLGGAYVDDIALENATVGGAQFGTGQFALYEGGWVPTAAGLVGVETPVARNFTLGAETGIRYIGALRSDDADLLPGGPISGANNGSDQWSIPLTLRGRYRF